MTARWKPPTAASPPPRRDGLQVLLGALAVILGAPLGLAALAAVTMAIDVETGAFVTLFAALGIGVVQGLWVVPLAVWAWARGRTSFLQGALGAAALVFLLNAGCYGVLFGMQALAGGVGG